MTEKARLEWSLFLLRLGVFISLLASTLDKIIAPLHAMKIYDKLYHTSGFGTPVMIIIGVIQLAIIGLFMAGIWKKHTYALVFLFQMIFTLSVWRFYFSNISLQLYAAWPTLAACAALFLLRDLDLRCTWRKPLKMPGFS